MTDSLMKSMIARLADPCGAVRMLAIRGLGNIATGSPEKVTTNPNESLTNHFCLRKSDASSETSLLEQ